MGNVNMPDQKLMEKFGFSAAEEYEKASPTAQTVLRQWFDALQDSDDNELLVTCKVWQRESLISESQGGTDPRIYFKLYACMEVAQRRYRAVHSKECPELSVYQVALDEVRKEYGFEDEADERSCNCDRKGQA